MDQRPPRASALPTSVLAAAAASSTLLLVGLSSAIHLDRHPEIGVAAGSGTITVSIGLLGVVSFAVHLGVALALVRARTRDLAPRYLLALLPVIGLHNSLDLWPDSVTGVDALSTFAYVFEAALSASQPGLILAFLTVFPTRLSKQGTLARLGILLGTVVPVAWVLGRAATLGVAEAMTGPLRTFVVGSLALANLTAVVRLLSALRPSQPESVRSKTRIVALPTAALALIVILGNNLSDVTGFVLPSELDTTISVVFPLSIAVAVSRRKLFEIDRLVRLGVVYASVSGLLLVLLVALVPWTASVLTSHVPGLSATPIASGLVAVVLFLMLDPLRRRVQSVVDRLFYRPSRDPMAALMEALRSGDGSPETDVKTALERVESVLHPVSQRIYLVPPPSPTAETLPLPLVETISAGEPGVSTDLTFSAEALASGVRALPQGVSVTPDDLGPAASLGEELGQSGAALILPLRTSQGEPLGLWALGEKRSEEPYTDSERQALQAVAQALSLSMERKRLAARVAAGDAVREALSRRLAEASGAGLAECPRCGLCLPEAGPCPEDGTPAVFTQLFPRRLGERYVLVRRLGSGGMGVVYAARDEALRREVAVKVLRHDRNDAPEALTRLRREAQLLARVAHPGVVAVHDLGELPGGGAFIVMERLVGRTLLGELLVRPVLPAPEAIEILDGILSALEAAHGVNVVHRDVKPANVFLTDPATGGARVRLMDFGLARRASPESTDSTVVSRAGSVVGSLGYMAPETLLGEPAEKAADLFAVGVVGYEMLAGRRPFPGTTHAALYDQMSRGAVTPLAELAPDVPGPLASVLHAALSRDPSARPRSATEIRDALRK